MTAYKMEQMLWRKRLRDVTSLHSSSQGSIFARMYIEQHVRTRQPERLFFQALDRILDELIELVVDSC